MKNAVYFLTIISCAVALPFNQMPEQFNFSKLIPRKIYVEPINSIDIVGPDTKIIGGTEVEPNSIPYQVAIVIDGIGLCGGSLISANHVLTAAHCTSSASFVEVTLGAHNLNEIETTQVRVTSSNIINHEGYNKLLLANDIAIIVLPSKVSFNDYISSISLAPEDAETYEGSKALLTGWGRTSDADTSTSPILLGISLDIISNTDCRNFYGSLVSASILCTSGIGNVGGCNGDSGGPLVVDDVQVGVVAFGSAKCETGHPTGYVRVSAYRSWIEKNTEV